MTDALTTTRILDAAARACAVAIGVSEGDLDNHIFAAGVTDAVTELEPMVVPLADDFTEAGLPAVTLTLGKWTPLLQPGNERLTFTLVGAIWRPRVPLGENTAALMNDRDALADAFIAHGKAFLHDPAVQSVVLMGGPGIRARAVPKGTSSEASRILLTLPFTLEVKCNRTVIPQPA
jgi:hypothetical protein